MITVKTSGFQDLIVAMDRIDDSRVYCGESDV